MSKEDIVDLIQGLGPYLALVKTREFMRLESKLLFITKESAMGK